MRVSRIVALARALLVAAGGALAKTSRTTSGGGFGGFGPSLVFADFAGLNSAFARAGITQKLDPMHWMFGGSGYAFIDRIVIGGMGWGGSQSVASDSLRARVSLSSGEFDVGYSVLSIPHVVVTPMLGIGGGGYTVELERLTGSVPNFDSLLRCPGRTSSASLSSFTLNPQLMVTIPISFVGLQLRGGYLFSPAASEWELADGGALLSGPTVAKGAPYVSLNIVFGGMSTNTPRVRVHTSRQENDEDESR